MSALTFFLHRANRGFVYYHLSPGSRATIRYGECEITNRREIGRIKSELILSYGELVDQQYSACAKSLTGGWLYFSLSLPLKELALGCCCNQVLF